MSHFPIELTPDDNGTFLATCPMLPEVTTWGETEAEALQHAADAVREALAARISAGQDIPEPIIQSIPQAVSLDTLTGAKVALYLRMKQRRINRAELGRRLQWSRESVDRLFKLDHASKITQLDEAFRALGLGLEIDLYDLDQSIAVQAKFADGRMTVREVIDRLAALPRDTVVVVGPAGGESYLKEIVVVEDARTGEPVAPSVAALR